MRLLMAASLDGYLCRDERDDMSWTGPADKALFRALTGVGRVCAAGRTTWNIMPKLEGRQLIPLSRGCFDLARLQALHPDAWLLGGPTVARAAVLYGMVDEFHLVRSRRVRLGGGVPLSSVVSSLPAPALATALDDVVLEVYEIGP